MWPYICFNINVIMAIHMDGWFWDYGRIKYWEKKKWSMMILLMTNCSKSKLIYKVYIDHTTPCFLVQYQPLVPRHTYTCTSVIAQHPCTGCEDRLGSLGIDRIGPSTLQCINWLPYTEMYVADVEASKVTTQQRTGPCSRVEKFTPTRSVIISIMNGNKELE